MTALSRLIAWTEKAFGIRIRSMPLPPPLKTIEEILSELNSDGRSTWEAISGYYAINSCTIVDKVINFDTKGAVLKAFFNKNSGEMRFFLAKSINMPEREGLFG